MNDLTIIGQILNNFIIKKPYRGFTDNNKVFRTLMVGIQVLQLSLMIKRVIDLLIQSQCHVFPHLGVKSTRIHEDAEV